MNAFGVPFFADFFIFPLCLRSPFGNPPARVIRIRVFSWEPVAFPKEDLDLCPPLLSNPPSKAVRTCRTFLEPQEPPRVLLDHQIPPRKTAEGPCVVLIFSSPRISSEPISNASLSLALCVCNTFDDDFPLPHLPRILFFQKGLFCFSRVGSSMDIRVPFPKEHPAPAFFLSIQEFS